MRIQCSTYQWLAGL